LEQLSFPSFSEILARRGFSEIDPRLFDRQIDNPPSGNSTHPQKEKITCLTK
jgi:hypothetical protein